MHCLTKLDSFNFKIFFLEVDLAHLIIKFLYLVILRF